MAEKENTTALLPGTYIGNEEERYRIDSILGAGGFGITYKAVDTLRNTVCAVKEYVPLGLCMRTDSGTLVALSEEKAGSYEHGRRRFLEEAHQVMELADVPNVVRVYDCFDCNGTSYFVMDYLEGYDVRTLMGYLPEGRFRLEQALRIVFIVGQALENIHTTKHILHRDISPDNIFHCNNGSIYLIDFGSAKHMCRQENQNFSVVLKPGFAPLEQYSSTMAQGVYTDVYALAGTFYYMITGRLIPPATDRINGRDYVRACLVNPEVPQGISDAVDAALNMNYKLRTQTARLFLESLFSSETETAEPSVSIPRTEALIGDTVRCAPRRKRAFVELANSEFSGKRWFLPPDEAFIVGRSSRDSNLVVPAYSSVSKQHCNIMFDNERDCFFVMDTSSFGTTTEQMVCPKNQWVSLEGQHFVILAAVCCLKIGVEYEAE